MQISFKELGQINPIKPLHNYTASYSVSLVVLSDENKSNARGVTYMSGGLKWWIRAHRASPDFQDWVKSFTFTFS